jgi:hypothetical protein
MPSEVGAGHLLLVWSPTGYRLEEREGDPPRPGELYDLGDRGIFSVQKVGASPLPSDARPCAFLIREP